MKRYNNSMNKNLSIKEVLKWRNESIEMEGNVNEEILIEKLKEITTSI